MTIKNIYIARHGYRMNWLPPPHPPNPTGIDSDPPLAPHGVDQAKELGQYIASLPKSEQPQFILSSPFYRCVQTAEPVSEALNIPIVLERGVGEWYKVGRGIIPEPANYDTLTKFFSHLASRGQWDRDNTVGVIPSLEGETEEQIFDRSQLFWSKFIPVFEEKYPEIETVLFITHAATKIALGMSLMGYKGVKDYLDEDKKTVLRAGACSIDKYSLNDTNNKWDLLMNGNCDFLSKGEEMNWNFHYGFEAGSDEDIKARQLEAENERKELEQTEDFYVTVDIPRFGEDTKLIKPSSTFQISNIIEDNPLMRLTHNEFEDNNQVGNMSITNEQVYKLQWSKLIGNDLIFDEHGELVSNVKEHLNWEPNTKFNEKKIVDDKVKIEGQDDKTGFYKKMIRKLELQAEDSTPMEVD